MATPGQMVAEMQMAMVDAWFTGVKQMLAFTQAIVAAESSMLSRPPGYRRWHDVPAFFADMMGHYGRRPHDVDVEHMR